MMENHPVEAVRTNIMGTRLLARLAVTYGVENFVMISTDKAVNPTNEMGASKRIAEIYVQKYFKHLSKRRTLFNGDDQSPQTRIVNLIHNVYGQSGQIYECDESIQVHC